jgi:hypothetical protein
MATLRYQRYPLFVSDALISSSCFIRCGRHPEDHCPSYCYCLSCCVFTVVGESGRIVAPESPSKAKLRSTSSNNPTPEPGLAPAPSKSGQLNASGLGNGMDKDSTAGSAPVSPVKGAKAAANGAASSGGGAAGGDVDVTGKPRFGGTCYIYGTRFGMPLAQAAWLTGLRVATSSQYPSRAALEYRDPVFIHSLIAMTDRA